MRITGKVRPVHLMIVIGLIAAVVGMSIFGSSRTTGWILMSVSAKGLLVAAVILLLRRRKR